MEKTQTNLLWAVQDSQNKEAWVSFYRIYGTLVRHFVLRIGLSEADADDVTQEVLLIAQKSLQEGLYDPGKGQFRQWLYGVSRKRAMAALRARNRRTRVQSAPRESGGDLLDLLEDKHNEEAAREVWNREWRYAILEEAMRHVQVLVGDKEFQAFTLSAIERWPVQQVAEHLAIAPASVYVYKGRVLAAVREWIEQFE